MLRYTDSAGQRHEVTCDAIAGCDGFHGICRPAIPRGGLRLVAERSYPYGWLGILAKAPPSTDEVIYCRHAGRLRAAQHAHAGGRPPLPAGAAGRGHHEMAGPPDLGRAAATG